MPIVEISSLIPSIYSVEINTTITGTPYNVEIFPSLSSSMETGSYYGILLGELKYTGYAYGDLVPYNTPVDGFVTWADYGQAHRIISSSAGTSLKAARLPTTAETASSIDGSRYALQALIPSSLRNSLSQIRYRAFIQCPPSASCASATADNVRYLCIWGNMSIRTYGGTMFEEFKAIGFYDNGALLVTSSQFPQYVEGEWYVHDFNIKMSPVASEGFIHAVIYRALDNTVLTSLYWTGSTGNEYDTSSYAGDQWGDYASVWGITSTTVTSNDTTRFPAMGPVYVYNSA